MFLLWKMMLFLATAVQLMVNVAVLADDTTQSDCNTNQLMASCNCEGDPSTEFFKKLSEFSNELLSNYINKEQQWKLELLSQAAECNASLHQHSLELIQLHQRHSELQQKLQDQFIKHESILEEIQISMLDKTLYGNITAICTAIHNSKCVGVRCYDLKLAQDMKTQNYLTAITMYENLITKLTPCLNAPNIHIQQLVNEKDEIIRVLKDREISFLRAAINGNIQLLRDLLTSGVSVNASTEEGNSTALMYASMAGNMAIVKLLIEAGAFLDAKNDDDDTAVIAAVENDHTETCKLLLEAGADVNVQNKYGKSALSYSVLRNNIETVKLLLEKGAEVDPATTSGKNTPLHTAARHGYIDIAKILVEHGANINAKNDEGKSPLDRALFYNQTEIVSYLMSTGAAE